jgi:hypothetical protein
MRLISWTLQSGSEQQVLSHFSVTPLRRYDVLKLTKHLLSVPEE